MSSDTIRAIVPAGQLSDPVVMPNINRSLNFRGQWALSPNNTVTFNVDLQRVDNKNQGIGGFVLAERASTRNAQNTQYQIRETAVLTKQLVHEIRAGYRHDYSRTTPATNGISINVLDSFSAGGAQNQSVNNNHSVELGDLLMYSGGRWSFKAGMQVLRRKNHNENYNNFFGTYTFSSLADYGAARPVIPGHGNDPMKKADVAAFQKKIDEIAKKAVELAKKGTPKEQIRQQIQSQVPDMGTWQMRGLVNDARLDMFYNEVKAAK